MTPDLLPSPISTQTPNLLPVTLAPDRTPGTTPIPYGPALNQILDFWFIDELHGWLVASICGPDGSCKLGLRQTINGGYDWKELPAPDAPVSSFGEAGGVRYIRFLDERNGWIFGPDLYATSDGGQSWQAEKLSGTVLDIAAVNGSGAWALASECSSSGDCQLKILATQGKESSWQELPNQPGLSGNSGRIFRIVTNMDGAGQVHPDQTFENDWVLGQAGPGQDSLAFSQDGGRSWAKLVVPCLSNLELPLLAAAPPQTLWLVCQGEPGAGQQIKKLFLSKDGGWTMAEHTPPPSSGYADAVFAMSDRRAFFGLGRGTLLGTTDAGVNWYALLPIEIANPDVSSGWVIRFYQQAYGWASLGDRLFRTTTSGQHWEQIGLP